MVACVLLAMAVVWLRRSCDGDEGVVVLSVTAMMVLWCECDDVCCVGDMLCAR